MDFFAAEQRAKRRTTRLLVLFGFAVAGTIAAGYVLTVFALRFAGTNARARYAYSRYQNVDAGWDGAQRPFWQPGLFAAVSLGTVAVIGLASLYKWSQYSGGGSAVAEGVGGRRVDTHTTDPKEHQLLNVVEEMAIASGLPVPAVYVLDEEPAINSFAAGLTSSDAVVTVTRGTLQKLSRDELQGVVAHEFSHILNGDMRMNVRVSAIIFGILVIGLAGRATLWGMRNARFGSSRGKGGGGIVVILAVGLALLVIGYVGYFFGRLIQASVSRQREFLADASAVQFTRNPDGVTGALKKIGGYAIGSTLDTHRAAEIGHFFFAQAFVSNFGGLWATHPPLVARITAIDPRFDGKFIEPPEVVDVVKEPWSKVAHMPPAGPSPPPQAFAAVGAALAAAAGTLTAAGAAGAQALLAQIPASLRTAARSPHDAPILLYGLLLDDDEAVRRTQMACVASSEGSDALRALQQLDPALRQLKPEHKLPVLQLAMPAVKALPRTALGSFAGTLDDLVQADGRVSPFEFALQRLVLRALAINRDPSAAITQIYSFQAVTAEISVVLSALAHASSEDAAAAARAFAEGASQLKLVEGKIAFLPEAESGLVQLDAALDKLATSSGPIKQRLLMAAAHVVSEDGALPTAEAELLRAVAASLDVPVPPMSSVAAAPGSFAPLS
ncbi:MAG TPA: M48 family metallopeptidase [Opitutaceae bacterium]|nr:M48 family metallopeptidase [Opitutaceae bacterium]